MHARVLSREWHEMTGTEFEDHCGHCVENCPERPKMEVVEPLRR